MKAGHYELQVKSTLDGLEMASAFVEEALKKHKVEDVAAYKVRLATEEAVTNVIKHGYMDKTGDIWLSLSIDAGSVSIKLKDRGVRFDPAKYPPPDVEATLDNREVGGLGVYMMKKMMDKMEYVREGDMNVTTMVIMLKGKS